MKTGEGVMDLVDSIVVPKEVIAKEIQTLGVMSDFEPAKKHVDAFKGENFLIVVDKESKYGEIFLLCVTKEAQEIFLSVVKEREETAVKAARAELEAEEAKAAIAYARANVIYEDCPIVARGWDSATSAETIAEIKLLSHKPVRDPICMEVTRPKRTCNQPYRFLDRNVEVGGIQEFRSHKDPHYVTLKESDIGIQAAPVSVNVSAQTTWYRSTNKAVQCEAATVMDISISAEAKEEFSSFLERAVSKIEQALDDCDTVNLFNETFQLTGDDEAADASQTDNELRELKNFADPNYSKMKVISCIDWMPKANGMVAVNAVRNMTIDQRANTAGLTYNSHLLIWDFRQLIRPSMLVYCPHEILTFRFNPVSPNLLVAGCATGQVVLWDLSDTMAHSVRKDGRSGSVMNVGGQDGGAGQAAGGVDETDAVSGAPVPPKFTSFVDFSHRRPVADIFWLPANTQINYRGQLVAAEHLDGNCYQFISVSADANILVWDIRYEAIGQDNIRHIGKSKHVPTEKLDKHSKEGGEAKVGKPLWSPIFRAGLKRLEGVGDLSLCRVSCSGNLKPSVSNKTSLPGDPRTHLMLATEEGDLLFADICVQKQASNAINEDDDEGGDNTREFLKWSVPDHVRPSVGLQQSPFFADVVLTVSDWGFHIWRIGDDTPIYTSPLSHAYLTCGCWSPTRPAVVVLATMDGSLLVWDFTDSSVRPSSDLKAMHTKITSMEFLRGHATQRQQLLAVGDETGTLHIFELPRNVAKPIHREETVMRKFIDREMKVCSFISLIFCEDPSLSAYVYHNSALHMSKRLKLKTMLILLLMTALALVLGHKRQLLRLHRGQVPQGVQGRWQMEILTSATALMKLRRPLTKLARKRKKNSPSWKPLLY